MAKYNPPPLTQSDLSNFVSESSDFAFEMSTLALLRSLDLDADHASTYVDPLTSRLRSYDIRARWNDEGKSIRFSVECKHLRNTAPLLIHATPRLEAEAFHTIIIRYRSGAMPIHDEHAWSTVYEPGGAVGRQTDQPTKDKDGFRSIDAATYDKWLQAVNGCSGLLEEMVRTPLYKKPEVCAIVPILVVPQDTLWQLDYDSAGTVTKPVRSIERTTLILRHACRVSTPFVSVNYNISHLEIVTLPALRQRIKNLIGAGGLLSDTQSLLDSHTYV